MAETWDYSDVWFLEAAARVDRPDGAELTKIIEAGDAINHAIFTPAEIEGAVNRLTVAGLLAVHDGNFWITPLGSGIRRRSPSKTVDKQLRWLQQALPTDDLKNAGTSWRLDGREYARATTAWHARASIAMNKIFRDRT